MKTVRVVVEVKVPDQLSDDSVAGYLDKFIDIGMSDLTDSIDDECWELTEEDKLVVASVWGNAEVCDNEKGVGND